MLVIREALLLQLQKDRHRQEIILTELAKMERTMALCSASCHGIVAGNVERANSLSEKFVPRHRWPVSLEGYADVHDLHDMNKGGRQGGVEFWSVKPAIEDRVCPCSRPCYCHGKAGKENAAFDEQKLQESTGNMQPKDLSTSAKWELTGITMPVKKSKLPQKWSCTICQVETPTESHLREHCAGKKHRCNVAALESRNKAISQKAETTAESPCADKKTSPIKWSCSTCQANGTSETDLKEHLNGRIHQQNIEAQCKGGDAMAKITEPQEAKSHQSIVPQHAEKAPPLWSCSTCQANCAPESGAGSHLLAKIQALLDEINKMARNSESREAKSPPNTVPEHAEKTSRLSCDICQANCDHQSDLEDHLGSKIRQLNVLTLHEEAKQMENESSQIDKNQQPPSEWDCSICEAKCYSESHFEHHCRGKRHRKKIEAVGAIEKLSSMKTENKVPTDGFDSMSASTSEQPEEHVALYFCEVCDLLGNSGNMLADHCRGEKHLEKQASMNFCDVCNLQCNSEKMLTHHRAGKKHLKKVSANK